MMGDCGDVVASLSTLDGSRKAAVALITGLSSGEIDELGGLAQPRTDTPHPRTVGPCSVEVSGVRHVH